ncbi:hypothetical protein TA3x_002103 [Tundrisphaera sp. TA3]|uniref:hypothetical protein n=1 Tax=Tundrisphaera sp. TA3 TaxID=3435775 RepID=UPI003EB894B1
MNRIGPMVRRLVSRRQWRWGLAYLLVVVGIVPLMLGPIDPPIPTTPPDEIHRVRHPRGYSMIVPPKWGVRLSDPNDLPEQEDLWTGICATPRYGHVPSRRFRGFVVHEFRIKEEDPSPGFHPVEFQGLPASEKEGIEETSRELDPSFVYRLIFERGGRRYLIRYDHPGQIETLPEMVRRYLLTFRVEGAEPG